MRGRKGWHWVGHRLSLLVIEAATGVHRILGDAVHFSPPLRQALLHDVECLSVSQLLAHVGVLGIDFVLDIHNLCFHLWR